MNSKQLKSERQIKAPILPKKLPIARLADGPLIDQERYNQLQISHAQLTGQSVRHIAFDQAQLKLVGMSDSHFYKVELIDSQLLECDLANAEWSESLFQRVEIINCRMTGFMSIEARFQDILFRDCNANLAQFRFSVFKAARFENCDLHDADFQEVDLSGVTFINCNLSNVEMSGARLSGADLRGCNIDGLRAGARELQGAIIDPTQAIAVVKTLGVVVKWPHEQ